MPLKLRSLAVISYVAVAMGVLLGIMGIVRIGSMAIALGCVGVALSRASKRRIERYVPIIIAFLLFALAIALPHGH